MRRLGLLAATAVLLAGCGSTVQMSGTATTTSVGGQQLTGSAAPASGSTNAGVPSGPAGGQPVPTTAATGTLQTQASAAGTGVQLTGPTSTVAGPIQLGFMTTTVGNAQQFGINAGQTYSDQAMFDALVNEYNAHGGLAGRKIVPVYGATDTASADWSTQFQAACQNLTVDHHVQAVLGYIFVFLDTFEQCLASHHVPHLYGGYQPGDIQAQKDFPSIVSVAHPTVDGVNETVLAGAATTGLLTSSSKLGILYDTCAHGDRAFARSTMPWLKQHHITYESVVLSCAGGGGDVGSAAAAIKSAELQFAAHGDNVVFVPGGVELLVFMENAESQQYRPTYLNPGGGAALEAQGGVVPQAQLRQLHSFGWMPAIDVDQSHQPYAATPQQHACVAKLEHQGLVPKQYNDFMAAYVACDSLDLYGRALTLTGGRSDAADIEAALVRVLPSFHGAATYGGAFGVSSVQRGGPGRYRESAWDNGCSCITYQGPVRVLPTL